MIAFKDCDNLELIKSMLILYCFNHFSVMNREVLIDKVDEVFTSIIECEKGVPLL